mgnify:FL=1|tara:strand:- start:2169 stop:2759 length:591 start_codon:yes stop_codon:yes gene_type:complete
MYKIGITGGIGSGKSTAADFFKDIGAKVFNADKEAKKHLKHTSSLQHKIINAFGNSVVENNKLNLKKLAEVAFSSKIEQKILNGLMWPEVFVLIEKKIKEYEAKKNKLFILDAAMIFEGNFEHMLDATLLISSKKELRLERALKRKNLHLEQIQNRMSLQMSESDKKKRATNIIENNGTLDMFHDSLKQYYKSLSI